MVVVFMIEDGQQGSELAYQANIATLNSKDRQQVGFKTDGHQMVITELYFCVTKK